MIDTKKTGGKNPLVELAQSIDIFARPQEDPVRGPVVADDWRDDPRIGQAAADPGKGIEAANAAGSFEAFMGAFGGAVAPPVEPG